MAVGTHFGIHIKIIQQHETPCQLVLVGSDHFREKAEIRIPVAFGHVPQHLVVGPVLLDDIEHVFDRTGIPHFLRNGIAFLPPVLHFQVL